MITDSRTTEQIALWGQALLEARQVGRRDILIAAALLRARADEDKVTAERERQCSKDGSPGYMLGRLDASQLAEARATDLLAAIPSELKGKT